MTVRVPFVDLVEQHRSIAAKLRESIGDLIDRGQFILGEPVERFEREAAGYLGVRHAVGVSSGTDALLVALTALGVGPGDEVITTPFGFVATAEAVLRVGATLRFVDIDPATLGPEQGAFERALSTARVFLPVHLFGHCGAPPPIRELATRAGACVVEDAAQAFGSRFEAGAAGTLGAAACFSFFPTKVLGALGDAGLVVTADAAIADRCRRLRQHGLRGDAGYEELGGNFRMDAVQAAALSIKLPYLDAWIARRREHAAAYDAAFSGHGLVVPVGARDGWNAALYTLRVSDGRREPFRRYLLDRGIETRVYYPRPLFAHPALRRAARDGAFPGTEQLCAEVLSLPMSAELPLAQRDHVVGSVLRFLREA